MSIELIIGGITAFAANVKQGVNTADSEANGDIIKALVKRVEVSRQQSEWRQRQPSLVAARAALSVFRLRIP